MIRAMKLQGFRISMVDIDKTEKALRDAVGGKTETINLRDGGFMICDMFALPKDKPYNSLASLIAGTCVYGDALIVGSDGKGFSDVPEPFMTLLNFPEDYFKEDAK